MTNETERPLSVTIISALYVLSGFGGIVNHFSGLRSHPVELGAVAIELLGVLGIVAGAFMLRGANWARWLALAWMAFHVAISYLNGWTKVAVHAVFLVVIAFFLLKSPAAEYFDRDGSAV